MTVCSVASLEEVALTDDAFLGGKLQILQPKSGYRAGLDAVMLAAAVPLSSARVLDVGAGVGTAGLCLARRDPKVQLTFLEKESALSRIAAENVERNGLAGRARVVEGDVNISQAELEAAGLKAESFDHVIANPPFHAKEKGTLAPDQLKAAAHAMLDDDLDRWTRFMARMAQPGGGATLIHKTEALTRLLTALDGRFGALKILPLHPREGAPAHRVVIQGTKGSRAAPILLPGFVLHGAGDAFTAEAQAILRAGAPLSMTRAV
ncbi:MAG: tRNA1(Val) (adenine(37)-N6)-methyltransferase [Hyphomicrobium sp.]